MKDNPQVKSKPEPIYLKDYTPPPFLIETIDLTFDLDDTATRVHSKMKIYRNPQGVSPNAPLFLNGGDVEFMSAKLNGQNLSEGEYTLSDDGLEIRDLPESFTLEIENKINPTANTSLEGLYKSDQLLCTQNEPEGFRNITFFIDRPDVMAKYRVKLVGDKKRYPIMLCNGNEIERGDLSSDKHFVTWEDPFPKPAYLFALVAGDLGIIEDHFTTESGRKILLQIYCDKGNENKCHHAMESLKKSMRWDEETYGLEYDLDRFMIVAVYSFNMGAMENKGLNIFNASCILADPATATDSDFEKIEAIIAHEYFHNWTGNRVTCRDWFQLTLKEGLTVFRDQKFSQTMHSPAVFRIDEVNILRNYQFLEDSGPTAHPIQPKSYIEINNFYTTTVYNKGAEIIRMIETLLGEKAFRKGIDKYFELYDGQAVTTEQFIHAMEAASGKDLTQFRLWYDQAGTPVLKADWKYDSGSKTFSLHLEQSLREQKDGSQSQPMHFPVSIALFTKDGTSVHSEILEMKESKQTFTFNNISQEVIPSINRHFTAPVKLQASFSDEDYAFLMAHDTDPFNRWNAAQEVATRQLLTLIQALQGGEELKVSNTYLNAFEKLLNDKTVDPALKAQALILPSESELGQRQQTIDIDHTHKAREHLLSTLANRFKESFHTLYNENRAKGLYGIDSESTGRRKLKNTALAYLGQIGEQSEIDLCMKQFNSADNMTDEISALQTISQINCPERDKALKSFSDKWHEDQLVMNKWLAVQSTSKAQDTFERVQALIDHPAFSFTSPNAIRALLSAFCRNAYHFHERSGRGYQFMADMAIKVDGLNPLASAGLMAGFKLYGKLDRDRKEIMERELKRILASDNLSNQLYEVASNCLK